jgi:predicted outer membrane repeat protein
MAVITVQNTSEFGVGSLRQAILDARAGDTVRFSSSLAGKTITLATRQLVVNKDLIIDGAGAPGLTISGNNQKRVFLVSGPDSNLARGSQFTLRNLTVANGFISNDRGGAIDFRGANTLRVENVNFYNNVSTAGAISVREEAIVTVIGCKFDGNDAARFSGLNVVVPTAGAINLLREGKLTVSNSEFTNNTGTYGGAIGTLFTETIVQNSTFVNNTSRKFGGALYVDGASWPSEQKYLPVGVLPKNVPGQQVLVSNSRFEGNQGAGFGGGIAVWGYDKDYVIIQNSTIINNSVVKGSAGFAKGGGLRLSGIINIEGSTIANNNSDSEGGGLWYRGAAPTNITDSNFSGNKAGITTGTGLGGAIYSGLWDSETRIANTDFDNNDAGKEGGAIYLFTKRPIAVTNSMFAGNGPSDFNNAQSVTLSSTGATGLRLMGTVSSDRLEGGANNDTLMGGQGNDQLLGRGGDDVLNGGSEFDILTGGVGKDRYILGTAASYAYRAAGNQDYALINDFNSTQDTIQLNGGAADYRLNTVSLRGITGVGIFSQGDLVALLKGAAIDQISLTANYINYL